MGRGGETGLPWAVIWIGVVTFLVVLGFGLVPPALPRYAVHYDLTNAEVGMLLTAFSTGMLAFSLPGGMIADKLGFRRVALAGCVVTACGAAFAATLPSFWFLIGAQLSQGVGAALYMTAGIAAIVAQTPDDRVGRATATYQGITLLGMSVAPALGGMAVQTLGLRGPFGVYAAAALLGFVVSFFVLHDPEPGDADADAEGDGMEDRVPRRTLLRRLLTSRAAVIALIVSFATHWAVGGVRNTLVPLFGEAALGMSPVRIGWLLTATSITNVVVIRHAGRVIDRGRRVVTIVSTALFALAIAFAAFAFSPWTLFAVMLVVGAAKGYAAVVPVAVITDVADRRVYGTAIGFQRTATSLGLATGPFTAGFLADTVGFRSAFLAAASLVAAASLIAIALPETAGVATARRAARTRGNGVRESGGEGGASDRPGGSMGLTHRRRARSRQDQPRGDEPRGEETVGWSSDTEGTR